MDEQNGCWPTASRQVRVIQDGRVRDEQIEMVLEEPLSLRVNHRETAVLMRLPGQEKELATGFCISEGLVRGFSDILTVHHCGQAPTTAQPTESGAEGESRNRVEVLARPEALNPDARLDVVRLIRAGCGAVDVDRSELPLTPIASALRISVDVLLSLERSMRGAQRLHEHAGGVHAAALFDGAGTLTVLCEDVGRHNAVDKAIGWCLLRGIPLDDKILLCSGRLSYEMVTKVVRLGIPVLASVSAPTQLAVALAERYNLTAIGYLRGKKMTIYAHPERVLTTPEDN
ncbi:MAG: formate dehydrogenase accessory sulfurtransferase FdhD [Anaerolineae bacterium]